MINTFLLGETEKMFRHKSPMGWIGVDLDGTLADDSEGWRGVEYIGKPIPLMVDRIKQWLDRGIEVRIFTARYSVESKKSKQVVKSVIQKYLVRECGLPRLDVTCTKDYDMIAYWDDRAVQVKRNHGYMAGVGQRDVIAEIEARKARGIKKKVRG